MRTAQQHPTFNEALRFWLKLGFISFGGPAGQIAIMHEYLVEKKKWISETKFLHALNYCMILPGPEAQQLATYSGWLLHGTPGGLAAGLLFILPSAFILLALSGIYVLGKEFLWINALFQGLKPAIVAIVILALIKIGKKSLHGPFHIGIATIAFVALYFFHVPFPLVILSAIGIAVVARLVNPGLLKGKQTKTASKQASDEEQYAINAATIIPHAGYNPKRFIIQVVVAIALWLLPLAALYVTTSDFGFWKTIAFFFTQAALVTFGGAYAVLPYVAQVSVEKFHWLSSLEMVDGLALGETTPGPLIMVLAFVGFMAGYNHYNSSFAWGSLGLATTTFYTFLPSFLFILVGAPIIERTQQNKAIKEVLDVVTAAVVGVVLNLTIYLGIAVLTSGSGSTKTFDYISIAWVVISFVAMHRFKVGMITWIGISAAFGLIRFYLL